ICKGRTWPIPRGACGPLDHFCMSRKQTAENRANPLLSCPCLSRQGRLNEGLSAVVRSPGLPECGKIVQVACADPTVQRVIRKTAMHKVLAALVGLAAVAMADTAAAETLKVAVAQRGFWNSTFIDVGLRQGYFKEAGLDIEILYTEGGASTLTPV